MSEVPSAHGAKTEGVQWEDPPKSRAGGKQSNKVQKLVQALMANPGRWAKVAETRTPQQAANRAVYIRRGTGSWKLPEGATGRLQTAGRRISEGVHGVWARYVEESK